MTLLSKRLLKRFRAVATSSEEQREETGEFQLGGNWEIVEYDEVRCHGNYICISFYFITFALYLYNDKYLNNQTQQGRKRKSGVGWYSTIIGQICAGIERTSKKAVLWINPKPASGNIPNI